MMTTRCSRMSEMPEEKTKARRNSILVLPLVVLIIYLLLANYLFLFVFTVNGESRNSPCTLPNETGNIVYRIEPVHVNKIEWKEVVKLSGWAFVGSQHADNSSLFIILKNNQSQYCYSSEMIRRPDVNKYFHNLTLRLTNTGYESNIPKSLFDDQEFQVGILIINNGTVTYKMTDYYLNSTSMIENKNNKTRLVYSF
jgi:hypothetical protein